jgi:hypothetical protein
MFGRGQLQRDCNPGEQHNVARNNFAWLLPSNFKRPKSVDEGRFEDANQATWRTISPQMEESPCRFVARAVWYRERGESSVRGRELHRRPGILLSLSLCSLNRDVLVMRWRISRILRWKWRHWSDVSLSRMASQRSHQNVNINNVSFAAAPLPLCPFAPHNPPFHFPALCSLWTMERGSFFLFCATVLPVS